MAMTRATRNSSLTPKFFLYSVVLTTLSAGAVRAQDPPTRVADLNYVAGNVSMQPAGDDDWSPAILNRPFTTGDNLWADTDGRAEFHLNNAVLRVGPQTSIGFLNLDDHVAQIRFTEGEFVLRVRHLNEDDSFEVDTPNAALTILREGEYRFNADPDSGTTWAVVRSGDAEVTGGGQAFTLHAGSSVQLSGTDQLAYDVGGAPDPDELEGWGADREAREARLVSARYLPPDVIGYEELDNYGTWRDTAGYGVVWYPSVNAGWSPYHDGHWAWIEPWGWTWIDDAPWGFAPAHYGRWAYLNGGWGWIPGPLVIGGGRAAVVTPVYAPALVAFIGGGNWGVSLSIGGPAVGWVPLGPGEVYAPTYHMSERYFRTVNVSNTTVVNTVNITNVYNTVYVNKNVTNVTVNQRFANMAAPNAVTAMPQSSFASGRPVRQAGMVVSRNQAAQITTANVTVAPPVAPVRQALAPVAGNRPAARPPARAASVQIVAKAPPPPPPVPFAAKQAALQQNAGRPLNVQAIRQSLPPARTAPAVPAVRVAPPARTVVPQVHAAPPARTPGVPAQGARPTAPNQPAAPSYRPSNAAPAPAPATPYRQPAQPAQPARPQPTPSVTQPNQPPPAYRPPPANPNPQGARPESEPASPRREPPNQPAPSYRPPPAPSNPPPARPPAQPAPQNNRPVERPQPGERPQSGQPPARPANRSTEKPKKDTEKDKPH